MATTRVVSVIGPDGAGKTTIIVAMCAELARQGHNVATIKLADQAADVRTGDTDTWRHFNEGHARSVLYQAPGLRVVFERCDDAPPDVLELVRRYHAGRDIVVIEGYSGPAVPRIEVYRKRVQGRPVFDPATSDPAQWIAMVTDDEKIDVPFPTFRFHDTAWLVTLSHLVWDRAMLVKG